VKPLQKSQSMPSFAIISVMSSRVSLHSKALNQEYKEVLAYLLILNYLQGLLSTEVRLVVLVIWRK
jgi:hypothetical protein